MVSLNDSPGVRGPRFRSEVIPVDDVSAIRRQSDVAAGLEVTRPGFGKLAGHASHFDDWHCGAVGQNNGHLQDCLHSIANLVGGRCLKSFSAVATLKQERLAVCDSSESGFQLIYFTGEHQGRKSRQFGGDFGEFVHVGPLRLLLDGK